MKHTFLLHYLRMALSLCLVGASSLAIAEPDPNYHIYICWGQSNMEGNATVPDSEKQGVDERFRMFYTADNCSQCDKKNAVSILLFRHWLVVSTGIIVASDL